MNVEYLGIKRFSRNPLICDILQRMNVVERVGSGIKRIKSQIKAMNLKEPLFDVNEVFFILPFYRDTSWRKIEKLKDGIKDGINFSLNQENILSLIRNNSKITAEILSEEIGINQRNIEKNLLILKNKGIIERVGSNKGGYWRVL